MNIMSKKIGIVFYLLFTVIGCSSSVPSNISEIKHRWQLIQVIYDDGTINQLAHGNFVLIEQGSILEVVEPFGHRRYSYSRKKNTLFVYSGDSLIKWEILSLDGDNLQLKTPIGLYILRR